MKLEELNPVDSGEYYIINCPQCGHHEAFVYKADVEKAKKTHNYKIHWFCNRRNKCGAKGILDEIKEENVQKFEIKPNINGLTEIQKTSLQTLCDYLRKEDVPFSIRGITGETLTKNDFIYFKVGFQKYLQMKSGENLQRKFLSSVYGDRDIMFPIFGMNGELQRILLRSKDKKQDKKEIQVKVAEKATEIWNLQVLKDSKVKTVFICEGVYDALSVLEVTKNRSDISAIALSGCSKFKKAILEIQKRKCCKGKTFIVCLDNDEAGDKAYEELKKIHDFKAVRFNLKKYKDMNEYLQANKTDFKREVIFTSLRNRKGENENEIFNQSKRV